MKPKWILLLLCFSTLSFLLGCGPTPATPTPTPIGGGTPTPTPVPSTCAASLGAPGNLSPAGKAIVPLTPTLQWEYPSSAPSPYPYPAGTGGCPVSGFEIHLISSVDLVIEHGGMAGSSATTFSPSSPLSPATLYFWEVRALTAGGYGPWSGFRAFFTGPVCDTASLAAPILYSPSGTIHDVWPTLNWAYPGSSCVPQGYRIDLSTSPTFADTSLSGGTGNPSTSWAPAHALTDCTTYHWRVAAINGTTLGPFSSSMSFTIHAGASCPLYFVPPYKVSCRMGPGYLFGIVAPVDPKVPLLALGRYQTEDGNWFKLQLSDGKSQCFLFESSGELSGDPKLLPILAPIDFPTLVPTVPGFSCSSITDVKVCMSTPGCTYDRPTQSCRGK